MTLQTSFYEDVRVGMENFGQQPFNLSSIEGFPYPYYIQYQNNLTRYTQYATWFYGDALNEIEAEGSGEQVPLYPVRYNPIFDMVLKHATALFGEFIDDGRPLVVPKLVSSGESDIQLTKDADEVLSTLWWENFGRSIMFENGILSQIYGGCIFGLRPIDDENRQVKIQISLTSPECFLGELKFGDKYRLARAWIIKPISEEDSKVYGYKPYQGEKIWWIESWSETEYSIQVNDMYVSDNDGPIHHRKNEDGFVPYVYIPHIRTGTFWGQSLIDNLKGIVAELNLRIADYGDAVNADAHAYVAQRNVTGSPKVNKVAPGLESIDLGSNAGITGNEPEPDMFEVRKALSSTSMADLVKLLILLYRQGAFLPAIADGEDEGSQRSALTLAMRMWPLTGHTNTERLLWTDGLNWFTSMLLRTLERRGQNGITQKHLKMRVKQQWAPALPKDRESFMTELTNRMNVNLGSPQSLLAATGEVEDIDAEMELIKEWLDFLAQMKAKSVPVMPEPPANGNTANKGGSNGSKSNSGRSKKA